MRRLGTCLVSALCLSTALADDEKSIKPLPLGAAAPDFDLPGVDGKNHTLKEYADAKILVVAFTCNHCPTAQNYEERLKRIADGYKDKGVALVAVSPNSVEGLRLDELGYTDLGDSFEDMKVRARDRKFNFPYLYDGDREEVSRAYGPTATPHVFVFDAERKLRYVGRVDDNEREPLVKSPDLVNALDALLAAREPEVKQTKSFGCSIKWADKKGTVQKFMAKLAAEPVTIEMADADALKTVRRNESGKVRLVNVWSLRCGPCVTEFPELVAISRMYRTRKFEFVAVCADYPDDRKEAQAFLEKEQASNRNLLYADTDKYKLSEALDPEWSDALPFTLLIAPGGDVLYRKEGAVDPLELRRAIVKALKEGRGK